MNTTKLWKSQVTASDTSEVTSFRCLEKDRTFPLMLNDEAESIVENDSEDHMDKRSTRLSPFEAILDRIRRPRYLTPDGTRHLGPMLCGWEAIDSCQHAWLDNFRDVRRGE